MAAAADAVVASSEAPLLLVPAVPAASDGGVCSTVSLVNRRNAKPTSAGPLAMPTMSNVLFHSIRLPRRFDESTRAIWRLMQNWRPYPSANVTRESTTTIERNCGDPGVTTATM